MSGRRNAFIKELDGKRENVGVPETPGMEPGDPGAEPAGKNGGGTVSVCGCVNDDEIAGLCLSMEKAAAANAPWETEAKVRPVTRGDLLSWGVIAVRDGRTYSTEAFDVLTGRNGIGIECGYFKNDSRTVCVDRCRCGGAIWDQLGTACRYVLGSIHLNSEFVGVYRRDFYEIPPTVIRELIVNAILHRDYSSPDNIWVEVYDGRLDVVSPGGLPCGQTEDGMRGGRSVVRNAALAHAFMYLNLVRCRGTGIRRVTDALRAEGKEGPEFETAETGVRVSVARGDRVDDPLAFRGQA